MDSFFTSRQEGPNAPPYALRSAEPPAPQPVRHRLWLHAGLFAATALTAAFAGSFFWEDAFIEARSFMELLRLVFTQPTLLAGWRYAFWLLLILGAHEMGHYVACRFYGIPATLPFFIPGLPPLGSFGAVIRIRGVIPHRRALFDVAAAGPLAGFAVALPVFIAGLLLEVRPVEGPLEPGGYLIGPPLLSTLLQHLVANDGSPLRVGSLYGAGWVGMLVTSMNLFPVGQLDGGHAAYAVSRTLHRRLARLTIAGLLGLVVLQVLTYPGIPAYTLWFVILVLMRDRHPRLADESAPLGVGRRIVALLLGVLFLASFIPVPLVLF